jgi:hypothetical protein
MIVTAGSNGGGPGIPRGKLDCVTEPYIGDDFPNTG